MRSYGGWSSLIALVWMTYGCAEDVGQETSDVTLGQSQEALTIVDPLDVRGFGVSGGYAEVGGLSGKGCSEMTVTYKIVDDTRDTKNPYYLATKQDFVDGTSQHALNHRGYIGVQTFTHAVSPPGKAVVFSMFDDGRQGQIVTSAVAAPGSRCTCGADGALRHRLLLFPPVRI